MKDFQDAVLTPRKFQMRFSNEASRLSVRDAEHLINNPEKFAERDPNNPLLARPTGTVVYSFDTLSAEVYRIFDSYLAASTAKEDVATLYEILLSVKFHKENMDKVARQLRAVEYAIWDAKYRFEELILKFIELSLSHRFVVRDAIERPRLELRKRIGSFFKPIRRRRGVNTHQENVRILIESDLSQLHMYLLVHPLRPEFGRPDVVRFIVADGRRRLKEHIERKREEFSLYEQSMNNALEAACDLAMRGGNFHCLVDAAMDERS